MQPRPAPLFYLMLDVEEGIDPRLTALRGASITEPRRCTPIRHVEPIPPTDWSTSAIDLLLQRDYWLVMIDPPYGFGTSEIDALVIFRRDLRKLLPVRDWPRYVDVEPARLCSRTIEASGRFKPSVDTKDIAARAILSPTLEKAAKSQRA